MDIGYDIDRFRILSKLGQGRTTEVYKVIDTTTEQIFALKLFPSKFRTQPELLLQFKEKVTTTARIFHKNVISIYHVGDHEDGLYYIMDYVNRRPLKDIFSFEAVLGILLQIVRCLEHCHAQHIFHRNLHPDNILVDPERRVFLTDFGFRKIGTRLKNRSHILEGNSRYMAPEQFEDKETGAFTDIYSLGVILYEMVTRRLPFDSTDPNQISQLHCFFNPPPPRTLNSNVPAIWDELIMRCIEKKPDDRFMNMAQLREVFELLRDQKPGITVSLPGQESGWVKGAAAPVANMKLIEEIEDLVDRFEKMVDDAELKKKTPDEAEKNPEDKPQSDYDLTKDNSTTEEDQQTNVELPLNLPEEHKEDTEVESQKDLNVEQKFKTQKIETPKTDIPEVESKSETKEIHVPVIEEKLSKSSEAPKESEEQSENVELPEESTNLASASKLTSVLYNSPVFSPLAQSDDTLASEDKNTDEVKSDIPDYEEKKIEENSASVPEKEEKPTIVKKKPFIFTAPVFDDQISKVFEEAGEKSELPPIKPYVPLNKSDASETAVSTSDSAPLPTESNDSLMEQPEPLIEHTEAKAEKEEPLPEQPEPLIEQTKAKAEKEEPLPEQPEPLVEHTETKTEKEEPLPEQQEPLVEHTETKTENEEPLSENVEKDYNKEASLSEQAVYLDTEDSEDKESAEKQVAPVELSGKETLQVDLKPNDSKEPVPGQVPGWIEEIYDAAGTENETVNSEDDLNEDSPWNSLLSSHGKSSDGSDSDSVNSMDVLKKRLKPYLTGHNAAFLIIAIMLFILILRSSCNRRSDLSDNISDSVNISLLPTSEVTTSSVEDDSAERNEIQGNQLSSDTGSEVIASSRPEFTLNVTTRPSGATVYMAGTEMGVTPLLGINPETSEVLLTMRLEGYRTAMERVTLIDAQTVTHHSVLERLMGKLSITSDPTGVSVRVGDTIIGYTPLSEHVMPSGKTKLAFELAGYASDIRDIDVPADGETQLNVALTPLTADLILSVSPNDAKVTVAGETWGQGSQKRSLGRGIYEVVVEREGYESYSADIEIIPGEEQKLEISLKAQEQPVEFVSTPKKARILVNGKSRGVAPGRLYLLPGRYSIAMTLRGYDRAETDLTVLPGKPANVSLTLKARYGEAIIYSDPTGAEVFFNGKLIGTTPLIRDDLEIGHNKLSLRDGMVAITKEIQIVAGVSTEFHVNMKPEVDEALITSSPAAASVEIDGKEMGETPLKIKLAPGIYGAVLRKEGYTPVSLNITSSDFVRVTLPSETAEDEFFFGRISSVRGRYITLDKGSRDGVRSNVVYQIYTDEKNYKGQFRTRRVEKEKTQGEIIGPYQHIRVGDGVITPAMHNELMAEPVLLELVLDYKGDIADIGPFFRMYDNENLLGQAAITFDAPTRIEQELQPGKRDIRIEIFEVVPQTVSLKDEGIYYKGFSFKAHSKTIEGIDLQSGTTKLTIPFEKPSDFTESEFIEGDAVSAFGDAENDSEQSEP